jgi:DNA-binding XRE family transcriptional regulator
MKGTIQSEDLAHEALTMAFAILKDRIERLHKEDRDTLFELVKELPGVATTEELESIVVAMREILEQTPIRVQAMDQSDEGQHGEGLQKWMDYVSGKIKALRKSAGLTQEELAEQSGLPQSHISRLESAKHSPSRATLEKIAAALGVAVSEFDPSA